MTWLEAIAIFVVFAYLTWTPLRRLGERCADALYDWLKGKIHE